MRSLSEARTSWQTIHSLKTRDDFKHAVCQNEDNDGLVSRSIYWKVFLLFNTGDHSEWLRRSADSRSAYVSLRTHFLRALDNADEIEASFDPLSDNVNSPWAALRNDESLRAEIMQDVDRCMPDMEYFRQPSVQVMMTDILFVYSRLNPDVSYRQGMHELLAPILWVIQADGIEESGSSDDFVLCQLCDARFIEHDTFTLFSLVMQNAKSFYEAKAHMAPSTLGSKSSEPVLENPVTTRINRIYGEYLPHVDPELATHLDRIDILPQVFLIRWIRLLFGREFAFDDVLGMWDVIFAEDPTLELVDLVCLIMIIQLRWELLEADYNTALTLLSRYPTLSFDLTPKQLVMDAAHLRSSFTADTARDLIKRYSGKEPELMPVPSTERHIPPLRPSSARTFTPPRLPANLESMFQDAAKNVINRGEKWGINKAVRDAVEEVKKGVRDIQTMPTPQAPRRHSRNMSRSSVNSLVRKTHDGGPRLVALQQRNDTLATMLKTATDQLWDYQKEAADGNALKEESVQGLSMAIAKVQFVQVYLEDPSIPLAVEENETATAGSDPAAVQEDVLAEEDASSEANVRRRQHWKEMNHEDSTHPHARDPDRLQTTASSAKSTDAASESESSASPAEAFPDPSKGPSAIAEKPHPSRPTLAQSSFSWMLGQSSGPSPLSSFARETAKPAPTAKIRSRGFLFGDEEEGDVGAEDASSAAKHEKSRGKRKEGVRKSTTSSKREDDGFDMSNLE